MTRFFLSVYELYGRLLRAVAIVAGAATFAIMLLIDASAFGRKLLNAPVPASVEITESLMTVAIMLPMGYALFTGNHLRVTLLSAHFPPAVRRWLFVAAMVIGFAFFAAFTWSTYLFALRSYRIDEHVWGATIRFPLYPAKAAICAGSLLLAVQFLLDAIRLGVFGLHRREDDLGDMEGGEMRDG